MAAQTDIILEMQQEAKDYTAHLDYYDPSQFVRPPHRPETTLLITLE